MSKRPSEAVMDFYEEKKANDILPAGATRNLELKIQSLLRYLDKVWEKSPKLFPVIFLLVFCQSVFASEPKLKREGNQIILTYETRNISRVSFPEYCFKNVVEATVKENGDRYIEFEIDPEGCERLRREFAVQQ